MSSLLERCAGALEGVAATLCDGARVARFLGARSEFSARDGDIFVASYPRSGTTWLQFLLHLLRGGDADFDHISDVAPWWERSLALGTARASDFDALPEPRVFKTHLPFRWLPSRGRCVYVWRDGRDVAVSYYHLYRSHLGFRGPFERFFERFMQGRLQYGSWFKHVAGWQRHAADPRVLLIRYEDLWRRTEECVDRLIAFCGLQVSAERRREAIETSRFDSMKAHEEKFDHIGELLRQRGIRRHAFIRRGGLAEGECTMNREQLDRFERRQRATPTTPDLEWRLAAFLH